MKTMKQTATLRRFLTFTRAFFSVMLMSMLASSITLATGYGEDDDDGGHSRFYPPTELGAYSTGHIRTLMIDPTRNADGTSGDESRALTVDIVYPSNKKPKGDLWQLTSDNPVYDGTIPAYGNVDFETTLPPRYGTRENLKVAKGKFPLLIYSHGSYGDSSKYSQSELIEVLASHGYIVVAMAHSGNTSSDYAAFFLGIPTTFLSPAYLTRAQDARFVMTQLLNKSVSPEVKKIAERIDKKKIGILGFSFGGDTSILAAAGSAFDGLEPDNRIKAIASLDGSLGPYEPEDYLNVKVPTLFVGNGFGTHQETFLELVNSAPKYYANISGTLHIPLSSPGYCDDARVELEYIQNNPGASPALILYSAFVSVEEIAAQCDASIYDGISDDTLIAVGYDIDQVEQLKPFMPLRKVVSLEEMHRMMKWYVVSFFNKELKGQNRYSIYLRDNAFQKSRNPLVEFAKNCLTTFTNPLDLNAGDKITMTPNGSSFDVSFSTGNALLPKGSNNLNLGDDDATAITLPFDFPVPGFGPTDTININSNGGVTNLGSFSYTGAPWFMRGELLLTGQFTVAALMSDFDPTAGGGVYAELEANRAVITWDNVPVYTDAGNGATNTIQVVLHENGTIELIFGDLAGTGPDYFPDWIGQVGIANGQISVEDFGDTNQVDFTGIGAPVTLPATAIFEQYVGGTANVCD